MAFTLSAGVITQSGTDADLTGLSAIAGVSTQLDANTGGHVVRTCDIGALQLNVTGTLTIPTRHWLKSSATTEGRSLTVAAAGALIIDGRRNFNRAGVAKTAYSEACGIIIRRPSGVPFTNTTLQVDGRLEQYGGILEASGTLKFNATSRLITRDAIWQIYDRGGYGYMNLYVFTDDLDVDGLTLMSNNAAFPGWFKNAKAGGKFNRYKAVGPVLAFSPVDGMSGNLVARGPEFGSTTNDFEVRFGGTTTVDLGTLAPGASPVGGYDFVDAVGAEPVTWMESTGGINSESTGAARQWVTFAPAFLDSAAKTALASGVLYLKDSNSGKRKTVNGATADIVRISSMTAGAIASQELMTTVWSFPGNTAPPGSKDSRLPYSGGLWAYTHTFVSVAVTAPTASQAPTLYAVADTSVTLAESAALALSSAATLDDLYDLAKLWKTRPVRAQLEYPSITAQPVAALGRTLDLGSRNIVINAAATAAFALDTATHTITVKAAALTRGAKFDTLRTTGTITVAAGTTPTNIAFDGSVTQAVPTSASGLTVTGTLRYNTNTPAAITLTDCAIGVVRNDGTALVTISPVGSTSIATYTDPEINYLDAFIGFTGFETGAVIEMLNMSNSQVLQTLTIVSGTPPIMRFKRSTYAAVTAVYFQLKSATNAVLSNTVASPVTLATGNLGVQSLTPPVIAIDLQNWLATNVPQQVWNYNAVGDRTLTAPLPTLAQLEASTTLAKQATLLAVQAKTDTLQNTDLSALATSAQVQALPIPTSSQNATAVRAELLTELNRIDVATSSRLAASAYTAPANADIAAIKAKTDTLQNTDLSNVATRADVNAVIGLVA